uniref:Uncharacterized protein n=1 Tax=Romanomermis culicivorax TaxID=13658 RepID=A0A915LAR5_ROMCU
MYNGRNERRKICQGNPVEKCFGFELITNFSQMYKGTTKLHYGQKTRQDSLGITSNTSPETLSGSQEDSEGGISRENCKN